METPGNLVEQFTVLDYINSGTYGSVHRAVCNKTGETVALKIVHVTPVTRKCAEHELALSARLHHPNIIRTYGAFEHDGNLAFVQEYANGGDLFDYINEVGFGYDEAAIKGVFSQMAAGVAHLHASGVSHRDIKPENVLLNLDNTAKITDFGLSEASQYVRGRVGTDPYAAPEVVRLPAVKGNRRRGKCIDGFAADVFSLGLTLLAMITGRLPWGIADETADADYSDFVERLLTHKLEGAVFVQDPATLGVSPHLCRLLDSMLHPDPRERAAISDVIESLSLPWFTRTLAADGNASLGELISPVTNGKVPNGSIKANAGDLDSGVSAGAASSNKAVFDGYCVYENDDALGDELPPLPSYLLSPA